MNSLLAHLTLNLSGYPVQSNQKMFDSPIYGQKNFDYHLIDLIFISIIRYWPSNLDEWQSYVHNILSSLIQVFLLLAWILSLLLSILVKYACAKCISNLLFIHIDQKHHRTIMNMPPFSITISIQCIITQKSLCSIWISFHKIINSCNTDVRQGFLWEQGNNCFYSQPWKIQSYFDGTILINIGS